MITTSGSMNNSETQLELTYFYDGRIYIVRDFIGLGLEVNEDNGNIRQEVDAITQGVDVKVRLKRNVPNKPILIEVEAKDIETINIVRQRAIEKWEV